MKRYYSFFLLGIIVSANFSCKKKEYPAPSAGTPVFYFDGTIDGTPVNIKAGINDYYMYSSFLQTTNGVYNFYGDLKPFNCSTCPNSIKFQINDYKILPSNAPTVIDSSLLLGYYSYQVPGGTPMYLVNFTSVLQGGQPTSWNWNFGDGITSLGQNPSHIYYKPGYHNVCLTATYIGTNTCTSSVCSEVKIGVPDAACNATFSVSPTPNSTINLLAFPTGGVSPFVYSWDLGDGTVVTNSSSSTYTHTYSVQGTYKVCLKVVDSQGCVTNVCKNIATSGFNGCLTNFDFYKTTGTTINQLALGGIIVTWTDASGTVYTSKDYIQPSDSYFRIISVENYSNNQNNQKTKKLRVNFKCKIFNGANSLQIYNADAVICIAYQ